MADAAADAVTGKRPAISATATVSAGCLQAYARDRLAAARSYPKDRLLRRAFRLARMDLTVWCASRNFADLCERTLVERERDDPSATRAEIYAMDAVSVDWDPPARWKENAGFSSREFERILAASNQRGFYDHDAPSWQFYDRATRVGVQTLPAPMAMPPWESGSPLRLFLHWAYAGAGMRLTHAATLGSNGRAALLAGASGSGKSATTLAGLLNGLESVGDDYVLLEDGRRMTAHSVFTTLKQDREGLRRAGISIAALDAGEANWRGKIEFDSAKLVARGLADRMEVCALLLPEIARATRTELDRVSPHEAALALAPSAVFQLPGDSTDGFRFFAGIARRFPAFRMKLSEDPAEIAGAVASFLEGRKGHAD